MRDNKETNDLTIKKTTALVFDRFYGKNVNAAVIMAGRVLIAAALSFFCMGYVFNSFDLPETGVSFAAISTASAIVFSLLFSFVRRGAAISVITITGVFLILLKFNEFWEKFSYFIDALILQLNGRLFDVTGYTLHPLENIVRFGRYTSEYVDGVIFGGVILCILFALITSAGLIGKPNIIPSLALFLFLWAPVLAAERLQFDRRLIPAVALYAGAAAIGSYYRDGLAIRHIYVAGGYRRKVTMDHRRFDVAVKSQSFIQRGTSRGLYYSKYSSSLISAAAMFAALGILFSAIFANSTGIDYMPLFEKLQGLNIDIGKKTPFKSGAEASYFASPMGSVFHSNQRLRLTAPTNDTTDILRVSKPVTDEPLFLRGDIGIYFDGTSWSSPVTEEPRKWRENGFDKNWLPIEMAVFTEIQSENDSYSPVEIMDINIEYLCDTDVVFTPAYENGFRHFADSSVNVFGDFSVRRKSESSTGEILKYTAIVPWYTAPETNIAISYFRIACESVEKINSYIDGEITTYIDGGLINYNDFVEGILEAKNEKLGREIKQADIYNEYRNYINEQYLDIPKKLKPQLEEYITSSGLDKERELIMNRYSNMFGEYKNDRTRNLIDRFLSAKAVSDHLKSNFSYSLNAKIDSRNPVMSFLNNSQSGHCALFASSMVLILRDWGIPARYCTGFVATADKATQTLQSKDLHAWCEVYLDELGWVAFDPTAPVDGQGGTGGGHSSDTSSSEINVSSDDSSIVLSQPESSEQSDTSIDESSASSTPLSSDTHEPSSDSSSPQGYDGSSLSSTGTGDHVSFAQVLPYIIVILSVGAGVTVVVFAVKWYNRLKKRAYKRIQVFHRAENSDYVYAKMLAVLRIGKLSPQNGEQPHEFFDRAEETLECSISENYKLFERLAFGNAELDTSERALLGRSFEKIFKAVENRLGIVGKVRLRMFVLSKRV